MNVPEQLPDVVVIASLKAQVWKVIQVDFLLPYLYAHRHYDVFKPVYESLPDVLEVVIAKNEIDSAVETVENPVPLIGTSKTEVAEMKHYIIRSDCIVPVRYDCLVHIMYVAKRTLAVVDYIRMVEMGI